MTQSASSETPSTVRVLIPVENTATFRQTIGYAIQTVLERYEGTIEIHFVYCLMFRDSTIDSPDRISIANALLDRVAVWAKEDAENTNRVVFETEIIGTGEYLFSPRDYADQIAEYCNEHQIDHIILDPEYEPGASAPMLPNIEAELDQIGFTYEEAPVERAVRRRLVVTPVDLNRFVALFGVSFLFYLSLGDPTYAYDLVTGVVVGVIVAISLSRVTFLTSPTPARSAIRLLRMGIYVPYLFWEILKSNIIVAAVILNPRLPIYPQLTEYKAAVWEPVALTTLANSITLTPGTLTVRAPNKQLLIHTLIPRARVDLIEGGLERAVRFVFYGRKAMRIATPEERNDTKLLSPNESDTGDE